MQMDPGLARDTLEGYIESNYPKDQNIQSDHEEEAHNHNQMAQDLALQYNIATAL